MNGVQPVAEISRREDRTNTSAVHGQAHASMAVKGHYLQDAWHRGTSSA